MRNTVYDENDTILQKMTNGYVSKKGDSCAICLLEFKQAVDVVLNLKCKHVFHDK